MRYWIDVLILLSLCYTTYRIFSHPFSRNIAGLLAAGCALLGSVWAFRGIVADLAVFPKNLVLRGTLASLSVTAAFFLMWGLLTHWIVPPLAARVARFGKRFHFPKAVTLLGNCGLFLGYLFCMLLLLDFFSQVVAFSPQPEAWTRHSLILQTALRFQGSTPEVIPHTMTPETEDTGATPGNHAQTPDAPEEPSLSPLETQAHILGKFRQGMQATRVFVARQIGADKVIETLESVKTLSSLSDEDKVWLINATPTLVNLVNNPSLTAVIREERVLSLVAEASQGSMSALYQLGDEPLIQALSEDQTFINAIRDIDLAELLQRAEMRTARHYVVFSPERWQIRTLRSSLELPEILTEPSGWTVADHTAQGILWPDETHWGVAAASLRFSQKRCAVIRMSASGSVTCLINGDAAQTRRQGDAFFAKTCFFPGESQLAVVVEFWEDSQPKRCLINITLEGS